MKTLSILALTLTLASSAAMAAVTRGSIDTDMLYGGRAAQPASEPASPAVANLTDRGQIDTSLLYGGAAMVTPDHYSKPGPHHVDRGQIDTDMLYGSIS